MHSGNYHLDHAGSTVLFGGRKMRGRKKRAPSNYAIMTIEKLEKMETRINVEKLSYSAFSRNH